MARPMMLAQVREELHERGQVRAQPLRLFGTERSEVQNSAMAFCTIAAKTYSSFEQVTTNSATFLPS
jgi:hypothetical protein